MSKSLPLCVIDVNGLGYEVETSMTAFFELPDAGQIVGLYTHLVIREDQHQLFGFSTAEERDLFRLLIKTSGVGPKLGLAILSSMNVQEFVQAIRHDDTASLVKLPGVGQKTAQRLILEMRDRLKAWLAAHQEPSDESISSHDSQSLVEQEATSALIGLGYKPTEASKMIHRARAEGLNSETLIRRALQGQVSHD